MMDSLLFHKRLEPEHHMLAPNLHLPMYPSPIYPMSTPLDILPKKPQPQPQKKTSLISKKRTREQMEQPGASQAIQQLIAEQNLKKKRLARKAELARLSRARKKERLTELEDENRSLLAEIARLKKARQEDQNQIRILSEVQYSRSSTDDCDRSILNGHLRGSCDSLSNSTGSTPNSTCPNSPASDLPASMLPLSPSTMSGDSFLSDSSFFLDVGPEWPPNALSPLTKPSPVPKQNVVEDLLGALKQQLTTLESSTSQCSTFTPLQTRFLKWALTQKKQFYESQDGLWTSLFQQELKCSASQVEQLFNVRDNVQAVDSNMSRLQDVLEMLKTLLDAQRDAGNVHLESMTDILSKTQLETLFEWINRFGQVCIKINV